MRKEFDFIGERLIPKEAFYGIHSLRACDNFPSTNIPFHIEWYQSVALVKLACYLTYSKYRDALLKKYSENELPFTLIPENTLKALQEAATKASKGEYFSSFIVPAIQGGAGTSINMNVNEIITNAALQILGSESGNYDLVDPFIHANIYQSTNDVIPTSLKICMMQLLAQLESGINDTRQYFEKYEKEFMHIERIAYTQMQEAVPSTFGRLFSTYSEAFSRDWWRVSKCQERLKMLNLGGGAIGTSLGIPRFFVMEVVKTLRDLIHMPIARSENMSDATANLDTFVEVHAILKAHAVNLEKIANDLRLLASDISHKEISIPQQQTGSSIMPGKVNPVIAEYIISISHKIYANDQLISSLSAQGCLDLNAYIPVIGHALIESIRLLINANLSFTKNLLQGIRIHEVQIKERFFRSPSLTTALLPVIGYHKASEMAYWMKKNNSSIFEANEELKYVSPEKLQELLRPENLLKEGFSIKY